MRVRRATFWCLASLTAAFLLGLAASYAGIGRLGLPGTDWTWKLQKGGIVVQTGLPSAQVRVEPAGPSWIYLWPSPTLKVAWVSIGTQVASLYVIPLWLPLLLSGTGTFITWRLTRAAAAGCVSCGYDLRGIKDRCPECGRTLLRLLSRFLGLPQRA
jgi:hypothetical protein